MHINLTFQLASLKQLTHLNVQQGAQLLAEILGQGQLHGIHLYVRPLMCLLACLLLSPSAAHGPAGANRQKHATLNCCGFLKCAVAVEYICHVK